MCFVVEFKAINNVVPKAGEVKPYLVVVMFVVLKPTAVTYEESLCFYGGYKRVFGCVCCFRY